MFATVGSEEKARYCYSLGADLCINYKIQDFETELQNKGVDLILDMVGGFYFQKNLTILREDGRLAYINAEAGSDVPLNIWQMMIKRLTITGSTLRGRAYEYKKKLADTVFQNVWPLIETGKVKPVIYKTFSYQDVAAAHRCMEEGNHIGKAMLQWDI